MGAPGKLLLLLHAHLPFVRHPDYERFLEENWLFEAISETYLPLVQVLFRLLEKGVPGNINLSVSPPLLEMLSDPLLIERYSKHLKKQLELIEKELIRFEGDSEKISVIRFYHSRQRALIHTWEEGCKRNILAAFKDLEEAHILTLLTCVGTHPFLPAYQSDPDSIRLQLKVTTQCYEKAFGKKPKGVWLPECGYFDGLDSLLAEFGFEYFFLETHGVLLANPPPTYGVFTPIKTPAGLYCIGREQSSSIEVWSRKSGYPGHPEYREFFRDIAFERERKYLGEYFFAGETPIETGLKYYRITGGEQKMIYRPWNAMHLVEDHARLFIANREATFSDLLPHMNGSYASIFCPYDAELFGHWWFEGPLFIEALFEKAAASSVLELASVESISKTTDSSVHRPVFSSWGEGGFSNVWMNDEVQNAYPRFFKMRSLLKHLQSLKQTKRMHRIIVQMTREILLFQSSDWAFMIHNHSAEDYAKSRLDEHYENVLALYDLANSKQSSLDVLERLEKKNNLFPWLGELL